ncbi:MAG: hypothetical protein LBI72_08920 [Flavobacteriaceae bacterium]|jgi:hypothetical protein|nr:hypothetical protein [Flavobacteriaceae bacterium]
MKNYIAFLLLLFVPITSISAQSIPSVTFLNALKKHCGKAFIGKIVSNPVPKDFEGKELIMYVMSCEADEVKIPFFVGDDHSRTWIFTLKEDRLTLKHDHRQTNGKEEKITMYGGTATNTGLEQVQFFPADQHTADLIATIAGNVWWTEVNKELFSYNLKRVDKEGSFRVEFDLSKPIQTDKRPW